jgi:hypothetical protein
MAVLAAKSNLFKFNQQQDFSAVVVDRSASS